MPFLIGVSYSRDEIRAVVRGDGQSYLPQSAGRIVCGCFRLDTNPHAPTEVLVGSGPIIRQRARTFVPQRSYVPIFIKRAVGAWEYVGDYRVRHHSTDRAEIERKQRDAGRDNVTMVLYLEQAPT